jgi:hypothetical protein
MSSKSINSRRAAQRSHSLTRRWSSGSGTRRRSGRGGKSGPQVSSHLAQLPFPRFQPDQKTIAQHYGDGVAMPSRPEELHPQPLTEPDLSLSTYPARATQ